MNDNGVHFGDGSQVAAGVIGGSGNQVWQVPPTSPSPEPSPTPGRGLTPRVGFAVDVIGYTGRPPAQRGYLQHRLVEVVSGALTDLGLKGDSDPGSGDDKMVILAVETDPTTVLPRLLTALPVQLEANNTTYADPIRLRLAIGSGLAAWGANGFVGDLPSELGRLLDAPALRSAATAKPWAPLVALVSATLHHTVIGNGYASALATQLTPVKVTVKNFEATAWLWPQTPPKQAR